jgi:hypothetical protein
MNQLVDYSNAVYADFTVECTDGILKYYRVFLASNEVLNGMLTFNGVEATDQKVKLTFCKKTINLILNQLDPRRKFDISSDMIDDVVDVANAAGQYQITELLNLCYERLSTEPKYEYLDLCAIHFPDRYHDYLRCIADAGLLRGKATKDVYLDAFDSGADFLTVAAQYCADKYEYTSEIKIPIDLTTELYKTISVLFNSQEASQKIIDILAEEAFGFDYKSEASKSLPVNKLIYFREMYIYDTEYRRNSSKGLHELIDKNEHITSKTGHSKIVAEASFVWAHSKANNLPFIVEIEKEYKIIHNFMRVMNSRKGSNK